MKFKNYMIEFGIEIYLNIQQLFHHRIGRFLILVEFIDLNSYFSEHLMLLVAQIYKLIEVSNKLID